MTVRITEEPGLADIAANTGDPSDAPYQEAAADFLDSIGSTSAIGLDFRAAQRAATSDTKETWGWWRALVDYFAPEYETVVDEREQTVELAAYYLFPPQVTGAQVELSVLRKDASETTASFTLAGTGGGPRFTVSVTTGIADYTTDHPRRAVLATRGVVQVIEKTKQGHAIGRHLRLVSLDSTFDDWQFPTMAAPPPAGVLGAVVKTANYGLVDAIVATKVPYSIARGTEIKASVGLKVEQLGIEATTSLTTSYGSEVSLAYTLPHGRDYQSTLYEGVPSLFWTP